MDNGNIVNGVYVELDTLVDSRLSLLYDIDKDNIGRVIKEGKYYNRYLDQFGYISVRLFRTLYSMRNSNVLNNHMPTEIPNLINDFIMESNQTTLDYNFKRPVKIFINSFPYNLSEESKEMLIMGTTNAMFNEVKVEIINKPNSDITPEFINEHIGLAIMYDALSWLDTHLSNGNLIKLNIPDVTFMTPSLIHRRMIIAETDMSTMFKDIQDKMSVFINLIFIPSKIFSFKIK